MKKLTREELEARANELKVKFAANIGDDTLRERVEAAERAAAPEEATSEEAAPEAAVPEQDAPVAPVIAEPTATTAQAAPAGSATAVPGTVTGRTAPASPATIAPTATAVRTAQAAPASRDPVAAEGPTAVSVAAQAVQTSPASEPLPDDASGLVVEVIGPPEGFRRAGRTFGRTPTVIPIEALSEEEKLALIGEPKLLVTTREADA